MDDIAEFRDAIETLRLYRRAKLRDDKGSPDLIKQLYVDPKPEDAVLRALKERQHTLLIGRKGTGKSTIFQRLQVDLRETERAISAYIDINTLFAHAQMSNVGRVALAPIESGYDVDLFKQISLARSFIALTVQNILEELSQRPSGYLQSIKDKIFNIKDRVASQIQELNDVSRYMSDVDASRVRSILERMESEEISADETANGLDLKLSKTPNITGGIHRTASERVGITNSTEVRTTLVRQFRLEKFVSDLQSSLGRLNIDTLFLIIDDYSELPTYAMEMFATYVLEPLDAMASELIKFKIAVYPGRLMLGNVDRRKFDMQFLDPYDLYRTLDTPERDKRAIEFVKRLLSTRVQSFCQKKPEEFFFEDDLVNGRRMTVQAVRRAAEKYFTDKVESFFLEGRFADLALAEKATINGLKGLLERIINRSHELQPTPTVHAEPEVFRQMRRAANGQIPTSHFHVAKRLESFFSTLELNNFLTKYAEYMDSNQQPVTVYALNYGLCSKYKITWYGSKLAQTHRRFFMEPAFDYTTAVEGYLRDRVEYHCSNATCQHRMPSTDRDTLMMYNMLCPKCQVGRMQEQHVAPPRAATAVPVAQELLLPEMDLAILRLLHTNGKPMSPTNIATELDYNAQQIGVRASALANRGLVTRSKSKRGRNTYGLTEKARLSYFNSEETAKATLKV